MGMQCHTTIDEIESAGFKVIPDSTSASSRIVLDKESHEIWYFYCSDNVLDKQLWFDIGQLQPHNVQKLLWLVRNRIAFNCN